MATWLALIRPAVLSDLPHIHQLLYKFHAESIYSQIAPNDGDVSKVLMALMDDGILLTNDAHTAAVGALVFPIFFNGAYLTAQELFWYVDESERGNGLGRAMMDALESRAREMGAKRIHMLDLASSPVSAENVYKARGYELGERVFIKEIE